MAMKMATTTGSSTLALSTLNLASPHTIFLVIPHATSILATQMIQVIAMIHGPVDLIRHMMASTG